MIRHCSLFKFKDGTSSDLIDEIMREFRALDGKIPAVKQLIVGRNIGFMADNYDIAANVLFNSIADYKIYTEDETHWTFVRAYLLPNLATRCAVQFDLDEAGQFSSSPA
jgi:hypothetical protein